MECASSEFDQAQNPLPRLRKPARSKSDRAALAAEFESFSDEIRHELNPIGSLERLLATYVIQAAWQLKETIELYGKRSVKPPGESKPESSRANRRPLAIERAARSVREAFEAFEAGRLLKNSHRSAANFLKVDSGPEIEPNEWPVVPQDLEGIEDFVEAPMPHWRDRLAFDLEVSDISPVVKGTWVTVGHVVSLIVDGWTWADILRTHPELSEDDIRACVTYAMNEENEGR